LRIIVRRVFRVLMPAAIHKKRGFDRVRVNLKVIGLVAFDGRQNDHDAEGEQKPGGVEKDHD